MNFGYDAGIFTPVFGSLGGNSTGHFFAPMLTGRFAAYFGDPEFTQYTISHKVNYLGKRNGLSVALAGAYQGKTDLYTTNTALGADFLFNWHALTVDGDWTFLWRQKEIGTGESRISAMAQTGYVRFGYNLPVKHDYVLEPLFMYTLYVGESDAEGQHDAALLKTSSGTDQAIDIGVNFYFNPDLRLSLHYTMRDGDPGDAGDGAEINNYFTQSGVGAIHRGDWLGLGVVAIF